MITIQEQAQHVTANAEIIHELARGVGRLYLRGSRPDANTLAHLFDAAQLLRAAADTLDATRKAAKEDRI